MSWWIVMYLWLPDGSYVFGDNQLSAPFATYSECEMAIGEIQGVSVNDFQCEQA